MKTGIHPDAAPGEMERRAGHDQGADMAAHAQGALGVRALRERAQPLALDQPAAADKSFHPDPPRCRRKSKSRGPRGRKVRNTEENEIHTTREIRQKR